MSKASRILAGLNDAKPYHSEIRRHIGGVTATILLNQINYWWVKSGERPFYKFRDVCSHPKYREGDSWAEELQFSSHEFDSALKQIAVKISTADATHCDEMPNHDKFVEYWTTMERVTYYRIHQTNFDALLEKAYAEKPVIAIKSKSGITVTTVNAESEVIAIEKLHKAQVEIAQSASSYTKTTSETTFVGGVDDTPTKFFETCVKEWGGVTLKWFDGIKRKHHLRSWNELVKAIEYLRSNPKTNAPVNIKKSLNSGWVFVDGECVYVSGENPSEIAAPSTPKAQVRRNTGKTVTHLSEEPPSSYAPRPTPPTPTETPDETLQYFAQRLEVARQSFVLKGWAPERIQSMLDDARKTLLQGAGLPDDTVLPAPAQPDAAFIQTEVRRAKQAKRYGNTRPTVVNYKEMLNHHAAQTAKGING